VSAIKKKNIAKIENGYAKQQEAAAVSAGRTKKLLYRRLVFFFVAASVIAFFMISTLVSQSSALAERTAEKKKLDHQLEQLKKKEAMLEGEIVKLNDDEYIAKLARKDYFLSEGNEIIFNLPKEEEKRKEKERSSN
jgi:cell division protein DivIC